MIIGSKAADTRVIWETRSPTWDQMIIFNDIVIWGDVNTIASNPPTIVTEIFDKDIGVRFFSDRSIFILLLAQKVLDPRREGPMNSVLLVSQSVS